MKKYLFILTVLILLFHQYINAQQIRKFSSDKVLFMEEMNSYMSFQDKNLAKTFNENYLLFWQSDSLSDEYRNMIYDISNKMLKKKMRGFPTFENVLLNCRSFIRKGKSNQEWNDWFKSLNFLVEKSTPRPLERFVELTSNLLESNTLYKSMAVHWQSKSASFTFKFDKEPYVEFNKVDLVCYKLSDSSCILGTSGKLYSLDNIFKGEGGIVDWRRAGLSTDSVYAVLRKYNLETESSNYIADSVDFYYKKLFVSPLLGRLEDKIVPAMVLEKATYPKFDSYDKRIAIPKLFDNIDYEGGFSMEGAKFFASGTAKEKAKMIFYKEGIPFIIAKSTSFIVRENLINSPYAEIFITIDKDSIYHPGVELKYLKAKNELSLMGTDRGLGNSPYYNSYHKVNMYFDAMYWKMNEPKINFAMFKGLKSESEALFESADYYDQTRYEKLQGIDKENPLNLIKKFTDYIGSKEFSVMSFSNYRKIQIESIRQVIISLASMGFLVYDFDTDMVKVQDRLYHYVNARIGKNDYDIIQFHSSVEKYMVDRNASLNLLNNDIIIEGVSRVFLSDSHNVILFPYDQKIYLKKNRDFDFQGRIKAGLFEFYGKDFNFDYDNFKVKLNNVDSFSFKIPGQEMDPETGLPQLIRIRSMIENVNGELLLDHPRNKSGFKSMRQYPIFNSIKDSYVFYDKPSIYEGVYNRENFFYQLNPFSFDSLDRFTPEGIKFSGYFASAGIFPDFDDSLIVMPDYSLGLRKQAPKEGFPMYEGKGTFFNQIELSNQGLHGKGEIAYISSLSKSDDFLMFPDSTNAIVNDFTIKEFEDKFSEFPSAKGKDVYMNWRPYNDVMFDYKRNDALEMFDKRCLLHGFTSLTPNGLTAKGIIEFPRAEVESQLFSFKMKEINSDTCDFKLKSSETSGQVALNTKNYKGKIDFLTQKGQFKANSETSQVEFPLNMYICNMDEFLWYMDKEQLDLFSNNTVKLIEDKNSISTKSGLEKNVKGSQFISIHPAQDSLRFFSPKAKYDMKNHIIDVYDVQFVLVADAAIFPDSGRMTILKMAELKQLENAKIMTNTATKFHELYDCNVNILGRRNYLGSGKYDYTDENDKAQTIIFENINVDATMQSVAKGKIQEESNFTLSPYFDYYGDVTLHANNPNLSFKGNTRIKHACDKLPVSWIVFESEINPKELYIPIKDSMKNNTGGRIIAGIIQGKDSSAVYSSFAAPKFNYSDDTLIYSKGFLYFDNNTKEYRIASMERIKENKFVGNYMSLNNYCDVYSEGVVDLSNNMGKVELDAYGGVVHKTKTGDVNMNLILGVDFYMSEKAFGIMEDVLAKDVKAQASNLNSELYYKNLVDKLGDVKADQLISELNISGSLKKFPEELRHNLVFSDVNFKWDNVNNRYLSEGDKISVLSVNNSQLNRQYKGKIEIAKSRSGDMLNIYLEDAAGTWFFFNYRRGIMQVISSNKDFNTTIIETKPEDRSIKGKRLEDRYVYQLSTEKRKKDFLKKAGNEESQDIQEYQDSE